MVTRPYFKQCDCYSDSVVADRAGCVTFLTLADHGRTPEVPDGGRPVCLKCRKEWQLLEPEVRVTNLARPSDSVRVSSIPTSEGIHGRQFVVHSGDDMDEPGTLLYASKLCELADGLEALLEHYGIRPSAEEPSPQASRPSAPRTAVREPRRSVRKSKVCKDCGGRGYLMLECSYGRNDARRYLRACTSCNRYACTADAQEAAYRDATEAHHEG